MIDDNLFREKDELNMCKAIIPTKCGLTIKGNHDKNKIIFLHKWREKCNDIKTFCIGLYLIVFPLPRH